MHLAGLWVVSEDRTGIQIAGGLQMFNELNPTVCVLFFVGTLKNILFGRMHLNSNKTAPTLCLET